MESLESFYELLDEKFKFEYIKQLAEKLEFVKGIRYKTSGEERKYMNDGGVDDGEMVRSEIEGKYIKIEGYRIGYIASTKFSKHLIYIITSNGIDVIEKMNNENITNLIASLCLSEKKIPGQGSAILYKFFTENKNEDREVIIVSSIQISIGFYKKVLQLFKENGVILDYYFLNTGDTLSQNIIIQLPPLSGNKKEEPLLKNEITIISEKLKKILENPEKLEGLKISEELKKLIKENKKLLLNSEAIKSGEIHLFIEKGDTALYFEEVEEE